MEFGFNIFSHCHYPKDTKLTVYLHGSVPPYFYGTTGIKEIKVIGNLTVLRADYFSHSVDLEVLDLTEAEIKTVGSECILGTSIKELILPEGVQEIGYQAFRGCDYLEFVHFPSTITKAIQLKGKNNIFCQCPKLKKIEVSNKMTDTCLNKLLSGPDFIVERDKIEIVRY